MRVTRLDAPHAVEWECLGVFPFWEDTRVSWTMGRGDAGAVVVFAHRGFADATPDEVLGMCQTYPGFEVDLFVVARSRPLAEWHLGRIEWADALRDGSIAVSGPSRLAKALPTWNRRSAAARAKAV